MVIDKKIKKKIAEEWLMRFPQLSAYSVNKIYKVVGCCVIGIELFRLPFSMDKYRPYFVIYALWKTNLKDCLDAPYLMLELRNKKGLQFDIPYSDSQIYLDEAVDCLKKQIPLTMNGDIPLKSLFSLIDHNLDHILYRSNSAQQAKLLELKFYISLYKGYNIHVTLEQIKKRSSTWNLQLFNYWYGDLDSWFRILEEQMTDHNNFLKQIDINKQDKNIRKLYVSEFIV